MSKKLLTDTKTGTAAKNIHMFQDPEKMKPILNSTRWEILKSVAQKPKFPAEIAREMGVHEQKIYYHIRQLLEANLIKVVYEEEIRGAIAKFYTTTEEAYGIELKPNDVGLEYRLESHIDTSLINFFKEFSMNGLFNGTFVVGSPEAHGPHRTWAIDGHYAIYLGMFIGQFLPPKKEMYVKLDVEIRAEKALNQNLILIGGPAVNLVTQDINTKMTIPAFDKEIKGIAPEAKFGRGIISSNSDKFYSKNTHGIIFKTQNPFDTSKTVIAFAGQGRRGTKAAILALIKNWDEILKDYQDGPFRKIVEGYDLDGDGSIDSVEIKE